MFVVAKRLDGLRCHLVWYVELRPTRHKITGHVGNVLPMKPIFWLVRKTLDLTQEKQSGTPKYYDTK